MDISRGVIKELFEITNFKYIVEKSSFSSRSSKLESFRFDSLPLSRDVFSRTSENLSSQIFSPLGEFAGATRADEALLYLRVAHPLPTDHPYARRAGGCSFGGAIRALRWVL